MDDDVLKYALQYASHGWPVFPTQGKVPLTAHGLKNASTDPALITSWWEQWPGANVAVVTGATSDLVVVDIDERHGGFLSLDALVKEHGALHTRTAFTGGGGLHYYFKHPGLLTRNKAGLWPGIDVRGDGGYVIAPPSRHESGGVYRWNTEGPKRVEELPPWLAARLLEPAAAKPLSVSAEAIGEGGRNAYLTSVAGALQRKGLSREAVLAALLVENDEKCEPPLPEREVEGIATSVSRYAPSDPIEVTADTSAPSFVRASDLTDLMTTYLNDPLAKSGKPTLLHGLDDLLGGGKRQGEVTVWHAVAKTGKNTLWHKLMHLWLEVGIPIAYASRELTPETDVLPNLLSIHFQENALKVEMTPERRMRYVEKIKQWPLYFAPGYGYYPVESLVKWVYDLKALGVEYFWFDHLHYMLEDPEDHKAAAKLIRDIRALAKLENIHVDIIVQPNKLGEGQALSLNSIKGGAAIGQALDNLLLMEYVKGHKNLRKITLDVARSKLAKRDSIYVEYDNDTMDFKEMEGFTEETSGEPPPITVASSYQTPRWDNKFRAGGVG